MKKILDLHIHSPYARACSARISPESIAKICEIKGIDIVATGDFTHPAWFSLLDKKLAEEKSSGLYKLKDNSSKTLFIFSTEVSLIYKEAGKTRKIHLVVHAPNKEAALELNRKLAKNYNIQADGRPILGMSAVKFVRLCLDIHPNFLIYPAHIWTPWYSVFGAKSGFDSLEACFQEETKNIYAYETGLSSDPDMNLQVSALDNLCCLSNSDAHSLENIGREANVMELSSLRYRNIYKVIKNNLKVVAGDKEGMLGTIEFYPEEGMYHLDGHRKCNFVCSPEESKRMNNICPVCHKMLTTGVSHRISELADRRSNINIKNQVPFKRLVGLDKIIAESLGTKNRFALKVKKRYNDLIMKYGTELYILTELNLELLFLEDARLAKGIQNVREGRLNIRPGFDGEYGEIRIYQKN